jgi:hypothetical protein
VLSPLPSRSFASRLGNPPFVRLGENQVKVTERGLPIAPELDLS